MDNDDVMWEEISAALGQVALLTKIIIEKVLSLKVKLSTFNE